MTKDIEIFNPYKMFNGSFIPEQIATIPQKELSANAKLIYGRLMRYAGKDALCKPKRETLSKEVGMAVATVDRGLKELCGFGLIHKKQRGLKKANEYYFLLHEVYKFVKTDSTNMIVQDSSTVQSQESSDMQTPIVRESIEESNSKRVVEETTKVDKFDDSIDLPESLGASRKARIKRFYYKLYKSTFGVDFRITNFGMFYKVMNNTFSGLSEYQAAALLVVHFNWQGMEDDNQRAYKNLYDNGFPLSWVSNGTPGYITYLQTAQSVVWDKPQSVKTFVLDNVKNMSSG